MVVPALVLGVAALLAAVVGVLALARRLPRNRVLGVRTAWTMASVDAFRRANRAAAPAFLLGGMVGGLGAVAATASASTTAAITMLVLGALGLVGFVGVAGTVGARVAAAEQAQEEAWAALPSSPCTAGATPEPEPCADSGACAGACALCPRGSRAAATDQA